MRHQKKTRKLKRTSSHRKAALGNMATELFNRERIVTTKTKAMALRSYAERLITLGKRGNLHARRLAARQIHDHQALQRLFGELAERYEARPGGYTRVLKLGPRRGDNATRAMIELVDAPLPVATSEEASE